MLGLNSFTAAPDKALVGRAESSFITWRVEIFDFWQRLGDSGFSKTLEDNHFAQQTACSPQQALARTPPNTSLSAKKP